MNKLVLQESVESLLEKLGVKNQDFLDMFWGEIIWKIFVTRGKLDGERGRIGQR